MRIFIIACILMVVASSAMSKPVKKKKSNTPVSIVTQSFLVTDSTGTILKEHSSNLVRPIASISKLMVGLLAAEQDLNERLVIPTNRTLQTRIPQKQETLTREELLTLALVKSDNFAAQILCDNIINCIGAMNNKASELGMLQTHYEEPTGLSKENVSTAHDLLKLMIAATLNHTISSISSMPDAEIHTGKSLIKIKNTNPLTGKLNVILSKTGFTNPAGGCLVMVVNSPFGQRFLVLLGSRNTKTRIPEIEKLYKDTQISVD